MSRTNCADLEQVANGDNLHVAPDPRSCEKVTTVHAKHFPQMDGHRDLD